MSGTPSGAESAGDPHDLLISGLVMTVSGALLVLLGLYYLVIPWNGPAEIAGVLLPVTMSAPGLAFGLRSLIRLRFGETSRSLSLTATVWFGLGTVISLAVAAGVLRSRSPWAIAAVLPAIVVLAIIRGGITQRRAAIRRRTG
jgi:hypothetical protein